MTVEELRELLDDCPSHAEVCLVDPCGLVKVEHATLRKAGPPNARRDAAIAIAAGERVKLVDKVLVLS